MILTIGRALLLMISFLGYFCYMKRRTGEAAIAPILSLTSIGVLMFAAGLLNGMVAMTWLILVGGILLLVWCVRQDGRAVLNERSIVVLGLFFVSCMLLFIRTCGQVPLHYDNFSHWLTVVRDMLKNDRMPNFQSYMITFQGYPTGAASFIYFIMKVLGVSRDDYALFAQGLLLIAALMAPLARAKKINGWTGIVWLLCTVFCLVANNSVEDLLVDTLISVLSIAVISIVAHYREEPKKAVLFSMPIQIYLITVKNSGILMVAINCAIMLAVFLHTQWENGALNKKGFWRSLGYAAGSGLVPAGVYYLWLQHVKMVYVTGVTAKHTASVSNYIGMLRIKSGEQVFEILGIFARRFFSWNPAWVYLIAFAAVLALGYLIRRRAGGGKHCTEAWIFAAMLCAYLAFMAVLAVMYILSMPYEESIMLGSYGRYEWTVMIYLVGIMEIYVLASIHPEWEPKRWMEMTWRSALVCLAVCLLVSQWADTMKLLKKENKYADSSRFRLEQLRDEYDLPENSTYLIVGSEVRDDAGYHYYLGSYVFWSVLVTACAPEDLSEQTVNRKWLIVLDESEEVDAFLRERGLEAGQSVYALQ